LGNIKAFQRKKYRPGGGGVPDKIGSNGGIYHGKSLNCHRSPHAPEWKNGTINTRKFPIVERGHERFHVKEENFLDDFLRGEKVQRGGSTETSGKHCGGEGPNQCSNSARKSKWWTREDG